MVLMEALVHQENSLVLILIKQRQWVYITSIAIVICFSMGKKSFKFRGNTRNVNFCNSTVLLILEKYLEIKICMIFE